MTTIRVLREQLAEARAELALAYPRALQAAAHVLTAESADRRARTHVTPSAVAELLDGIAGRILALTPEDIERRGAWRMSNVLIKVDLREGCAVCPFEHNGRCLAVRTPDFAPYHVKTPATGIHEDCPLQDGCTVNVQGEGA